LETPQMEQLTGMALKGSNQIKSLKEGFFIAQIKLILKALKNYWFKRNGFTCSGLQVGENLSTKNSFENISTNFIGNSIFCKKR
jgi:hypothetical protein